MATTLLECDELAAIVLDTEGTDAVGASETMAMALLTVTTLLSSYLIYNSKKVPQKGDLDKMRCFSKLSTSLLAQRGTSTMTDAMKRFFPRFHWLLRDMTLTITNREGEVITPTEYLHARILASQSGEPTDLGKSLCNIFPSLECSTVPMPGKGAFLRNMFEQQDQLQPAFNRAINELIHLILQQLEPKRAIDGATTVNGSTVAALVSGYVDTLNTAGSLPDLEQGWQAVIRLQLTEYSDKLVKEYDKEMEESLKGNLPMEERNLMRLHEQILTRKRRALEEESCRINPLNSKAEDILFLVQLEQQIIKRSEPSNIGEQGIVGGILNRFVTQNHSESQKFCKEIFMRHVKKSKVQDKCNEAIHCSKPLDIDVEVERITQSYNRKAVGPATGEVLEEGLAELKQFQDTLKRIPGTPQNIRVIGRAPDRIKLSWESPAHNPGAAESYVVMKRDEGGTWEEIVRTNKTKALVVGLDSAEKYEFTVRAVNDDIIGLEKQKHSLTTESKSQICNKAFFACPKMVLQCPIVLLNEAASDKFKSRPAMRVTCGMVGALSIPLFAFIAPTVFTVSLPRSTILALVAAGTKTSVGDLTPVADEDMPAQHGDITPVKDEDVITPRERDMNSPSHIRRLL